MTNRKNTGATSARKTFTVGLLVLVFHSSNSNNLVKYRCIALDCLYLGKIINGERYDTMYKGVSFLMFVYMYMYICMRIVQLHGIYLFISSTITAVYITAISSWEVPKCSLLFPRFLFHISWNAFFSTYGDCYHADLINCVGF